MKKLFTLLLALVATTALWAHDFEVNGIYYKILTDKTNEVEVTYRGSSYSDYNNEYSGSVTIPATVTYNGTTYSITSIGVVAFASCSSLTSVTIPNSVTSIGNEAFRYCEGLISVTIGNSVTSIGWGAFYGCSGLTSVTIPNSVTSIGDFAFRDCSSLTSVTIGNSVTSIGDYAFYKCSGLTSIIIPNSVTSIEGSAFEGCTSLTSVTIPNSVTSIGWRAFADCSGLKSIVWNAENCADFSSYSDAPFSNISSQITSFIFGDSVKHVPAYLCYEMSNLTSITIPNSVISIEDYAFYDCSGLTSIESLAETPPTLGSDAFYNVSTTIPVYVPCGSVSAYQSAEGWNAFTNIQCGSNEPSADLENTHSQSPMANRQKLLRNGQFIILRDGVEYSAQGQIIKE